MKTDRLTMWVLYNSPTDFPGQFVIRGQDIMFTTDESNGKIVPHRECLVGPNVESVEREFKTHHPGLHYMARHTNDDPKIVGLWL